CRSIKGKRLAHLDMPGLASRASRRFSGWGFKPKPASLLWVVAFCFATCVDTPTPTFAASSSGSQVDFNRDVRRVLSENCFKCHGPATKERKGAKKIGGLRLDTSDGARADLGGYSAIVPGHPEKSELIHRITTKDPDDQMPPPKSGKKIQPGDVAILTKWI